MDSLLLPLVYGTSQALTKGKPHQLFTLPATHNPRFSSRINISALPCSAYLFSVPPLSGHFVYINHTVTLRIPKMASASAYST